MFHTCLEKMAVWDAILEVGHDFYDFGALFDILRAAD